MKRKPYNPTPIHPVILFDGVCNFCNGTVNFVIKKDRMNAIKFSPLQSIAGAQLKEQYGIGDDLKSFIFIENGKAYKKSTAALHVCKYLKGIYKIGFLGILIPTFLRDLVYDYIAKNRYKWFGQKDTCMIPSAEIRAKFLV
jgi:predicted DCC family thiol-disulfide oxidoreductase YuxK